MKEQITGRKTGQEEQHRISEKEAAGQKAASFEKAQKEAFLQGLLSGELSFSDLPEGFLGKGTAGLENSFLESILSGGSGDAPILTSPPALCGTEAEDDESYVNHITAPAPLLLSSASLPDFPWDAAAELSEETNDWHVRGREEAVDE